MSDDTSETTPGGVAGGVPGDPDGIDTFGNPQPGTGQSGEQSGGDNPEPGNPVRRIDEDGVIIEGPEA